MAVMPTPCRAFAFLDIDHPIVAWEVYRGVLVSALARDKPPRCPVSMMFASIIQHQDNVRFQNELLIEHIRQQHHPDQISRLTALYLFHDKHLAELALTWGAHFLPENLAELEFHPVGHVSRLDSNWITNAPRDNKGQICRDDLSWISRYWSGEPYDGKPLWEMIGHGRAFVLRTTHRERAYGVCVREFPDALDMLEVSRICAAVGSDLGHTLAWITQPESGVFELKYYLDMRDANDPAFLQRLASYTGPKNWRDLAPGKETFGVGDLRAYFRTFRISVDFGVNNILNSESIHHIGPAR